MKVTDNTLWETPVKLSWRRPIRPLPCRLLLLFDGLRVGPLLCPSVLYLEEFPGGQLGASGEDKNCRSHLGRGDSASELGGLSPEMAGAEGSRQKELRCLRRRWVLVGRREMARQVLSLRIISDSNSKDAKPPHPPPASIPFLTSFFF